MEIYANYRSVKVTIDLPAMSFSPYKGDMWYMNSGFGTTHIVSDSTKLALIQKQEEYHQTSRGNGRAGRYIHRIQTIELIEYNSEYSRAIEASKPDNILNKRLLLL